MAGPRRGSTHDPARGARRRKLSSPADQVAKLSTPVLLLLGGDSPPLAGRVNAMLEKPLPNARTVVMPGQQHIAMDTAPDLLVGAVLDFWGDIS